MNNNFEYYTLKLKTLSPVFVGSGKEVGKKEFCYSPKKDIIRFIDMNKFMEYMMKKDAEDSNEAGDISKSRLEKFEAFMLDAGSSDNLNNFMNEIAVLVKERSAMTIYKVSNGGCFDGEHSLSAISCFMRNKQNKAYIPGSSIKGMLRTMLLQYLIKKNHYRPANDSKHESDLAEQELINTLTLKTNRDGGPKIDDAVNSIMKGLIISDSEFIDDSNFIVCKKYDIPRFERENAPINIARECVKPGVEIAFKIKIDKRYFKPKNINESFNSLFKSMIAKFDEEYRDFYLSKFHTPSGNKMDFLKPFVILGGGSGFFAKNIIYTLNGFDKGLEKVSDYMKNKKMKINGKDVYPNAKDYDLGISPHMLKETKYGGSYYHFGLCEATLMRDENI